LKSETNTLNRRRCRNRHVIEPNMTNRFALHLHWVGLFVWASVAGTCLGQLASNLPPASAKSMPGKAPLVIPRPKILRLGSGVFQMQEGAKWSLSAAARDERLCLAVRSAFGGAAGDFVTTTQPWFTLKLGAAKDPPLADDREGARWAANAEGYRLVVGTNGVVIQSSTAQGAFYGLQTLAQLWRSAEHGRVCPTILIEDWPSMRFRGVHWFPSASGIPMHEQLITNVLSALKFNRSVIQCEAAHWDKHPEITAPNAISKTDLRKLVEACRTRYLEPIPLVNVPGHAEWAFRNGSNLAFAEDPQTPYAYCVNNPKSYAFIEDVLGECLPIFDSKLCHIGHDEVSMRGRFPNPECALCKDATVTDLVVKHSNRLTDWLAKQGVQSMIWGDMLLGPGEAKDATHAKTLEDARKRRAEINKKTIIVDWHYVASADARSIEILRRDGFQVVVATWYTPENIRRLAQAALAADAEGLLQTTWMGYFPDRRALRSQLQQFAAFVLAAEYSWSGRGEKPEELGYDAREVFNAFMAGNESQ
jgi:hexosaminidase